MGLYLWELLVPCQWNGGKPIKTKHHKEWDKRIRKITGGLTIMTPSKGQWVCPYTNELYEERMIPVRIMCTENQIHEIVQIAIEHYEQHAIMFFKVSDSCNIVVATEEQKEKFRDRKPKEEK